MIHKMLNLMNALLHTQIQKHHAAQVFWFKGYSMRKVLVDSKFVQNCLKCLALNLVQLPDSKCSQRLSMSSRDCRYCSGKWSIHLHEVRQRQTRGIYISLLLEKCCLLSIVAIQSCTNP
jgi:hypothetical protein